MNIVQCDTHRTDSVQHDTGDDIMPHSLNTSKVTSSEFKKKSISAAPKISQTI